MGITDEEVIIEYNSTTHVFSFLKISSLHVKNSEKFLLKIKSNDSVIIVEFDSMHVRDLAKSILIAKQITEDQINKHAISSIDGYKNIFQNLKDVINTSHYLKSLNKHESLFLQKGNGPELENSPFKLNQTLLDIFVSMNCSLDQFFNQLSSSYFYDIKNPKNIIDRLLADKIRSFNTKMDYATRINTFSYLNNLKIDQEDVKRKETKSKSVEFRPIYYQEEHDQQLPYNTYLNYELKEASLIAEIVVKNEKETQFIDFEPNDFKVARDLCKLAYESTDFVTVEEIKKFSINFENIIEGKYGKGALSLTERIIPTFYANNKS